MNSTHQPAQIPHNLHYSNAMPVDALRGDRGHTAPRKEVTLVGAVGIENNNGRDSMDLRGTRRSATSLKRNGKERKGMPIAPLMLPSFFSSTAFPSLRVFIAASNGKVGFGQNFCGTDGKPVPHST